MPAATGQCSRAAGGLQRHAQDAAPASVILTILARDVIYTARAYATMSVSICLSVCLSVAVVHWRIIGSAHVAWLHNTQKTERTGQPPVMNLFVKKRNNLLGHVARLGDDTPAQRKKPFGARLTSTLNGFLAMHRNVLQVAQEASNWITFALTTTSRLQLVCGDVLYRTRR